MGSGTSSPTNRSAAPPIMFRQSKAVSQTKNENNQNTSNAKTSEPGATRTNESSQKKNDSQCTKAGERSRPLSAMSRNSMQTPMPGEEEEDPTPEDLVRNNPKFAELLPLLEKMIKGCQECLVKSDADLQDFGQVGTIFESTHVEMDHPGQVFMAEYLAVRGFLPTSKQLFDKMLQKAGINNLLLWEVAVTDGDPFSRPELVVAYMLRSAWWNTSDASLRIARKMAPTTIFEDLICELRECGEEQHTKASFTITFQSCVGILHNCAKETSARQQLREQHLVEVLIPYLKAKNAMARVVVLMTLGLIIDESQNHLLLSDDKAFDMMLQYTRKAQLASNRRHDGFKVEELVVGICNIAKNEPNKKILVDKDVLSILEPILKTGTNAEKQVAVETVLELAFDARNHAKIKEKTGCMEALEGMMTSSNRGIKKAAQGAMWLLSPDKLPTRQRKEKRNTSPAAPGRPPTPGSVPPPPAPPLPISSSASVPPPPPPPAPQGVQAAPADKKGGHIMISYSWSEQKLLLKVRDALRERGMGVWMDVDDMGGSTLQAMAEAVEEADVVLICLSQRYKESQNCRIEAEYAFKRNKRIIPLRVERGYVPDGWLGIISGAKLFFDFSGKYPFERKMEELVKELNYKSKSGSSDIVDAPIKSQVAPVQKKEPAEAAAAGGSTVEAWKSADITKWVKGIGLAGNKKLESMTGEDLAFLKDLSIRAPEYYFGFLERKLGLDSLQAIRQFSNAVDRLP